MVCTPAKVTVLLSTSLRHAIYTIVACGYLAPLHATVVGSKTSCHCHQSCHYASLTDTNQGPNQHHDDRQYLLRQLETCLQCHPLHNSLFNYPYFGSRVVSKLKTWSVNSNCCFAFALIGAACKFKLVGTPAGSRPWVILLLNVTRSI